MSKNIKLFFIALTGTFLLSAVVPKPLGCPVELYNNWNLTTSEKVINKALRKKNDYYSKGTIYFSKGYLHLLKTGEVDTASFMNAIELYKSDYSKDDHKLQLHEELYKATLCYYYLGNYSTARMWAAKVVKAKYPVCGPLVYAKCLIKLHENAAADTVITNYSVFNGLKPDSIRETVLTDIKNGY